VGFSCATRIEKGVVGKDKETDKHDIRGIRRYGFKSY